MLHTLNGSEGGDFGTQLFAVYDMGGAGGAVRTEGAKGAEGIPTAA